MDHVLTLVCYRPNGSDYCRGCLMESTNSDHVVETFRTAALAASFWAGRMLLDEESSRGTSGWEVTLLIDGWQRHCLPDSLFELDELYEEVEVLAKTESKLRLAEKKERDRLTKEAAEAAKARRDEEAADKRDRVEFERLRTKFGADLNYPAMNGEASALRDFP